MRKTVSLLVVFLSLLAGCNRRNTAKSEKAIPFIRFAKQIERPVCELRITALTIPKIEEDDEDGWGYLVFPPVEGQPVRLLIKPNSPFRGMLALFPRKLNYTIWLTKWEDEYSPDKFSWEPEIAMVEDQGMILYDASICPLHHTQKHMQRGAVEISYGVPGPRFMDGMAHEFPGGPGFVNAFGCVPGSEKVKFGYRCDACIAAYERWEHRH